MKKQVYLDAGICIYLAFLLMTVPVRWILASLIASAFHELGHIAAVLLMGGSVSGIQVGVHGTKIVSSPMPPGKNVICILAGPAASLFLLCFRQMVPRVAICGFIQGIFNLLPIGSLDGANIVRIIKTGLLSQGSFSVRVKIPCKEGKERVQ